MTANPEPASPAPLVSVITATYNWSSVLRCAIQSVLWQTLQDFEMLVIGDGCTDDSGEVVASFNDPRVRWHNLPHNTGHQSIPNNTGLAMGRGKYIAYLGHDDLWHPTHLAALVDALQRADADVGNSICLMIGPPGSEVRQLVGAGNLSVPRKSMPPSSIMHKRSLIDEIGNWKEYRETHADPEGDLLRRAEQHGGKFVVARNVTVFKFPSAWRPNSYREKRCEEQANYARRIQTEPDFMQQEMIDVALAYAQGKTAVHLLPKKPRITPLGWRIEQYRRVRGLEARPLAPLTPLQRMLLFLYPFSYPIRKARRAVMKIIQSGG